MRTILLCLLWLFGAVADANTCGESESFALEKSECAQSPVFAIGDSECSESDVFVIDTSGPCAESATFII